MKLTGLQIFWIVFSFTTGNTILLTVSPAASHAKQDVWISYLLATVLGLLIIFVASKVGSLHSCQSFVEYINRLLGKWLGTVVAISFLVQWYSVIGIILVEFSHFAIEILLPTTPTWLFFISLLSLTIYVVYTAGIESIGRCSEVFGPIILVTVILTFVLIIPAMDMERLLPIYFDSEMLSIMKGTLSPLSFLGECVIMLMVLTFASDSKKGPIWAVGGFALSAALVCAVVASVVTTLGPEMTAKEKYPAFDAISFINVMNFIQNLEIVAILIWILSVFIKISVYFFLASYGTAKLFHIKKWRKTNWFTAAFVLAEATVINKLIVNDAVYQNNYWIPIALPVNMAAIPLLLWIVGKIKTRKYKNSL